MMEADWKECKLGEVVTLKRGYDLPTDDRNEGEVPIVSSSGITGWHDSAKVEAPGVVTGRYGTLGEVFFMEEDFWPLNTSLYVKDFHSNDPRFIHYFLHTINFEQQNAASSVPGVNRNHLHKLDVRIPPLPVQRRTAGILGAYDDLIANNRRRIELLEEMATAIFREWFVHYRFPGHADVETRETEIGAVPEGWTVKSIGELATSPRSRVDPEEMDPDTPYFGLGDMPKESIALSEWGRAEDAGSKKYSFDRGDILFGKIRPYFHKVGPAPVPGICSTDAIVIVPNSDDLWSFVLGHVSSDEFVELADQTSSGTKMPRAKWKILKEEYKVVIPPPPILQQFNDTMQNLVDQIHNLIHRNHTLRKTRDLLLPRLVAGEVEIETEMEMARKAAD
ncbi:MAG: restriction endonuclease subunit S [Salinibacter sp.]